MAGDDGLASGSGAGSGTGDNGAGGDNLAEAPVPRVVRGAVLIGGEEDGAGGLDDRVVRRVERVLMVLAGAGALK